MPAPNADAAKASTACLQTNDVINFLQGHQDCTNAVQGYFKICAGEVVQGQTVPQDTVVNGTYCPNSDSTDQPSTLESIGVTKHMVVLILLGLLGLFALIVAISTGYRVEEQTRVIIERLGRFNRISGPGFHLKIPFLESIAQTVDLRVQQHIIEVESKTKDDVTVKIRVAVQSQIPEASVYDSYYKCDRPEDQMEAYVFDAIRATVPSSSLDDIYANRDLDKAIEGEVRERMASYGYHIIDAPVTNIEPDEAVKVAMNQVNAQQRLLEAARSKAEAQKVTTVKEAEAQAESKALQGKGIADERLAIAKGLQESAMVFEKNVPGVSVEECMTILLLTQYFDMLRSVGANSNTIMLPHSPAGLTDMTAQLREAIIAGSQVPVKA